MNKIELFNKLLTDRDSSYDSANKLIKDICDTDRNFINEDNYATLSKFTSVLPIIAEYVESLLDKYQDNKQLIYNLSYTLFRFYLKLSQFDKVNQYLEEMNAINRVYDFNSGLFSEVIYEDGFIRIEYDLRLDKGLSAFLISDLTKIIGNIFNKFNPKPTIYLLNGTGPSPFDSNLNTVYLNCGHYSMTETDRKRVTIAIIHEFTHFDLYRDMLDSQKIRNDLGCFKLFDEGLAQYNSFLRSNIQELTRLENNFSSSIYMNFNNKGFKYILENWISIIFKEKNLPLYELSHSFISYLIDKYSYKTLFSFIKDWISNERMRVCDYFEETFKCTIENEIVNWVIYLEKHFEINNKLDFKISLIEKKASGELALLYESNQEIWPEKNIFVIGNKEQVYISSENKLRYQREGQFCFSEDSSRFDIYVCKGTENIKLEIQN